MYLVYRTARHPGQPEVIIVSGDCPMEKVRIHSRRDALLAAGIGFCGSSWAAQKKEEEEDVTPAEDLMREHGVLKRVLLIYREVIRRIDAHEEFAPATLTGSAKLI